MLEKDVKTFIDEFSASLKKGTFVKMTLGNYKGTDEHLQKIHIRLIETKRGTRLFFLYRYDTRDTAKNFGFDEGRKLIAKQLGTEFFSGHLFTTSNNYQLDIGKKGRSRLNTAKPTFSAPIVHEHDRQKRLQVDPNAFYLQALGITTETGEIRARQQDKWRQINKFVEILAALVDKSELKDRDRLRIVDMGSGKGYLTFAAYDYFKNIRGMEVEVTGVETRTELIDLCSGIAAAAGFTGLNFVVGNIADHDIVDVDVLIALHACNTATDDALYKGIAAKAGLIVAAPCCHQELRPQLSSPDMLRDILKHGIMAERTAELLTDGIRSLLLERSGYTTKLFEFISVEHTPKNNMLVGTRSPKPADPAPLDQELNAIFETFGIKHQRLFDLLNS